MTSEEMERAIEFLLKNQADFDTKLVRLAGEVSQITQAVAQLTGTVNQLTGTVNQLTGTVNQLSGEVREIGQQLHSHAETQTELIKVVTSFIQSQSEINDDFRATQTRIAEDLRLLATTVHRNAEGRDSSTEQT